MAQSIGYLLAAAGPATLGLMRDLGGAWQGALLLMMALQFLQFGFGWYSARSAGVVADQDR
jgi:CP family cyanate transporter-like MFS transporter